MLQLDRYLSGPLPRARAVKHVSSEPNTHVVSPRYNPNHEANGKFGSGSSGATGFAHMQQALEQTGGFSVNPSTGSSPHTGYQVAVPGHALDPLPTTEQFNSMSPEQGAMLVRSYMDDNAAVFDQPNMCIGGWAEGGHVYLEPSETIQSRDEAVAAGVARGQMEIYDNAAGTTITTGDTAARHRGAPEGVERDDGAGKERVRGTSLRSGVERRRRRRERRRVGGEQRRLSRQFVDRAVGLRRREPRIVRQFGDVAPGLRYNPNHGEHGLFASGGGQVSASPEAVKNACARWDNNFENVYKVRTAADQIVTGHPVTAEGYHATEATRQQAETDARALISGVQSGAPSTEPLYRGMTVPAADVGKYQEGQTVSFSLGSFSSNPDIATYATNPHFNGFQGPDGVPVFYQLDPGARNVDFNQAAGIDRDAEHITGGTFQVEHVEPWQKPDLFAGPDGVKVTLRQVQPPAPGMTLRSVKPRLQLDDLDPYLSGDMPVSLVPRRYNPNHGEHGQFATGSGGVTHLGSEHTVSANTYHGKEHPTQTARQAARVEKATARIQKVYPNANVNLQGADPKLAEETSDAMVKFQEDYPGAAGSIENVRLADDLDQGVIAQTSPDINGEVHLEGTVQPDDVSGYSVLLNREYFDQGSLRATNAMMKEDGPNGSGFHPGDTPEYAIQHELGHVLDNHITQQGGDDARPSNQLVDHLYSATGTSNREPLSVDKVEGQMSDIMGTTAIGYAVQGGPAEAFAEIFSIAAAGNESQLSEWGRGLIDQAKSNDHGLGMVANRSTWMPDVSLHSSCGGFVSPEARLVFAAIKANPEA